MNASPRVLSKPIRTVLRWQVLATVALVLLTGALAGGHGALSAAFGGAISVSAGWASAMVATTGRADSAGGVLVTVLKAEGVKLGLIACLLGLVFAIYTEVVVPAFLGSFVATALIFSMAFFVREHNQPRS
ncbi:MAG: ATP synthase subunit I [Betaproteobacteria bacterium]